MYEVEKEFARTFLDAKLEYNSFNEAIRLARSYEANEGDVQSLIKEKQELRQTYMSYEEKMLKRMEWDSNLIKVGEGWYGIRYQGDKDSDAIKFEILIEKDVPMLERDTSKQRDYNRVEIDTTLPAYIDEEALELYKQTIARRAIEIVHDRTSISIPECSNTSKEGVKVSAHAGKRWVQRKLQITANELEAEEYRRVHLKEVEDDVVACFSTAECVWQNSDGINYWFDANNIMYVVGNNNTIITLYEEDFGFNKEINKSIVMMQVDVLKSSKEKLDETEVLFQHRIREVDQELGNVESEISVLEAKLSLLASRKSRLLADREENGKLVRLEREKFNAQYSKLFKKWDDR